jgi:hypothetical protein
VELKSKVVSLLDEIINGKDKIVNALPEEFKNFSAGLNHTNKHSLRLFIWQQDLRAVVRFVHECFVFRSSLLVAAG